MGDIENFIEMSIIEKTMHRRLTDDRRLLEELKTALLAESAGMFLWVYLQLEIIWSTCFTDAEIQLALSQLPKDLEDTYQYCLQRINLKNQRTVKVLKWVTFGARPLHIEELREAVAFDMLDTAWNAEKVPRQDFIIGCCANLVVLDPIDHCVRFAHSSVKQYLTNFREGLVPTYPVSEEQGQLECGEFCVAYLSFSNFSMSMEKHRHRQTSAAVPTPTFLAGEAIGSTFRHFFRIPKHEKGITTLSFPGMLTASTPKRNQFKFLNYAIMYWAPQTRHIRQSSSVWNKFEQLATNPNEYWNFHPWVFPGVSKSSRLHGLLGWAVKERHEPLLCIALSSGKYIRQICNLPLVEESLPAIHLASKLGYYDIVRILLNICNVNALDLEHCTALHHAASKGYADIVRLILDKKGALVDTVPKSKVTPLWLASANGHDNVVSLLVENGASIETRDDLRGETPLYQAAKNGHCSIAELLIRRGANLEAKNKFEWTPLYQAGKNRHKSMVKMLLNMGARTHHAYNIEVLGGMESGKSAIIQQMRILSDEGLTPTKEDVWFIQVQLLRAVKILVASMQQLDIKPVKPKNREYMEFLLEFLSDCDPGILFGLGIRKAIPSLLMDESVNKLMENRAASYLPDSAPYLFNEAKRIIDIAYLATVADCLKFGTETTGMTERTVRIDNMELHLFDIEGSRSERENWDQILRDRFEGLVVFCAALSDYDRVIVQGGNRSRLSESLLLFDVIANSSTYRSSIILFLTKFDILKQKLNYSPLERYFPDYTGGNDADSAAEFILEQYERVNKGRLIIYPHIIEATNTTALWNIFPAIKTEIILSYYTKYRDDVAL